MAAAVSPAWRGAGLVTVLLFLPAEAAAGRGIRTSGGGYLADDRPVTALVRNVGRYADQITEHGIAEFSVQLGGPARRQRKT